MTRFLKFINDRSIQVTITPTSEGVRFEFTAGKRAAGSTITTYDLERLDDDALWTRHFEPFLIAFDLETIDA